MEKNHVRHHCRAEDPCREQHTLGSLELRYDGMEGERAPIRPVENGFDQVGDGDDPDHPCDERLERAEAAPL